MADAVGGRAEDQIAHFLTLEALQEYHYRIFQPGAQLHYIGKASPRCGKRFPKMKKLLTSPERPLVSYGSGLVTATLRIREGESDQHEEHLRNAFVALYDLYGEVEYKYKYKQTLVL